MRLPLILSQVYTMASEMLLVYIDGRFGSCWEQGERFILSSSIHMVKGVVAFAPNSLRALRLCELTVLVAFEMCLNGVIGLVGTATPIARAIAELGKSRRIALFFNICASADEYGPLFL